MAKRLFDILVAGVALLLLGLPLLVLALWVRLDSPGPALFRQERIGRHGRPFRIRKFRTMHYQPGADFPLTTLNDARVTRAGRWMRARRLDELPQLLDVLQGHMSLVGPRPEVPRYVAHYPAALRDRILSVRPGITDPAALAFRHAAQQLAAAATPEQCSLQDVLPQKLELQARYIEQASFAKDLGVLLRTAAVLFTR